MWILTGVFDRCAGKCVFFCGKGVVLYGVVFECLDWGDLAEVRKHPSKNFPLTPPDEHHTHSIKFKNIYDHITPLSNQFIVSTPFSATAHLHPPRSHFSLFSRLFPNYTLRDFPPPPLSIYTSMSFKKTKLSPSDASLPELAEMLNRYSQLTSVEALRRHGPDLGDNCLFVAGKSTECPIEDRVKWLQMGADVGHDVCREVIKCYVMFQTRGDVTVSTSDLTLLWDLADELASTSDLSLLCLHFCTAGSRSPSTAMSLLSIGDRNGDEHCRRLLDVLSDKERVFDGPMGIKYSQDQHLKKFLETSFPLRGLFCMKMATKTRNLTKAIEWLRLGEVWKGRDRFKVSVCLNGLLFAQTRRRDFDKYKYMYSVLMADIHCGGVSEIDCGGYPPWTPSLKEAGLQFIIRTLLSGSLKKHQTSSLSRSFFSAASLMSGASGERSTEDLLSLIAGYVVKKEEKEKETNTNQDSYIFTSSRSSLTVTSLFDISLSLFDDLSTVNYLYVVFDSSLPNDSLSAVLPLFFSLTSNITSLQIELWQCLRHHLFDVSCLTNLYTSKLTSLDLTGAMTPLSSLWECSFASLETFTAEKLILRSLNELTKLRDFAPKTIYIRDCDLGSIASICKLNLSRLESLSVPDNYIKSLDCLKRIKKEGIVVDITRNLTPFNSDETTKTSPQMVGRVKVTWETGYRGDEMDEYCE